MNSKNIILRSVIGIAIIIIVLLCGAKSFVLGILVGEIVGIALTIMTSKIKKSKKRHKDIDVKRNKI